MDSDVSFERVWTWVLPCSDALPIVEFGEHILDFVALFVESLMELELALSIFLCGMEGCIRVKS